jgi:hypothetical protein
MPRTRLVHTTLDHLKDWSSLSRLKVCPLCGSLNVESNDECFCCRWSGGFERDQRLIQLRVAELAMEQPELRDLWRLSERATVLNRMKRWLSGWRRYFVRIDFRV